MSLYDKLKTGIIGGGGLALGKIFSLKPIDGNGDFIANRASDGTRRNSAGVIVTEPTNMPRADYKDGRSCPAILSEPLSQNLIANSEPTANEGAASNITYESFNWSNGFTNCTKFGDNSLNASRYAGTSIASTEMSISAFIIMDDLGVPSVGDDFDLKIAGINITDAETINQGNNIYRVQGSTTAGTGSLSNNGITKSTSQSDKGFRVVGWQLEEGAIPTSYMASNNDTPTRQPDIIEQLQATTESFNSPKGTIFLKMASITTDDEERKISFFGDPNDNEIRIRYYNQGIGVRMIVDGVNVASFSTQQLDQTPFRNIAFNWDETSCSFWVDGEQIGSAILTESYPEDTLLFCSIADSEGTNQFRGWLEELSVYDNNDIDMEDLTDYNTFEIMANNLNYTVQ